MREPQEIEDRYHEQVVLRAAAVDVAKASGVVCTRVPREDGRGFVMTVWPVDATANVILELADHLAGRRIEKVVLESTSDYWRPFLPAGSGHAGGGAGECAGCEERAGPPQDRQAGCGVAGEAGRVGHAAASFVPHAASSLSFDDYGQVVDHAATATPSGPGSPTRTGGRSVGLHPRLHRSPRPHAPRTGAH
jgi:hypothetical protein